jgi:hypothetical protein
MLSKNTLLGACFALLLLPGCDRERGAAGGVDGAAPVTMQRTGYLASGRLMEASGLQASHARAGDFFVHNDDGEPDLYAIDQRGAHLGRVSIVPARNRDWEDLAAVPVEGGRWIVAGDIGDNWAKRDSIMLYFAEEPRPGPNDRYSGFVNLQHWLELTYPDGPRDCESMAYDPVDNRILLLSKRDKPPRLYAVELEAALTSDRLELELLGTIHPLRPPTLEDRAHWGGRTDWISQPTGMDISPDGTEAVVLTYRSLYRFRRRQDEDWLSAMQRQPDELIGPPAPQNEAVAYSIDGKSIFVTTEKLPAPVHKVVFNDD